MKTISAEKAIRFMTRGYYTPGPAKSILRAEPQPGGELIAARRLEIQRGRSSSPNWFHLPQISLERACDAACKCGSVVFGFRICQRKPGYF
jgi:hypothetical protein